MKHKRSRHQKAFLAAFVTTCSYTKAAEACKIDRALHYRWLKEDATYPARFAEAKNEALQLLEDECVRRAHEGILTPVWYKGKAVGVERLFSDPLLMFKMRAMAPETYRDHGTVEISGVDGGPIVLADSRFDALSDEELASLIATAGKLKPIS